ncbi:MAG: hypothetical protein Q4C95_01320 [Planctomycetia bacterium]|nr:hypothetical protein [Planctomycetia bacterium]
MTTYRCKNNGLSLLEIMISILVLSFGLIGVLASIPFGSYQMSKMNDADYTGNLARNAIKRVLVNELYNPSNFSLWFSDPQSFKYLTDVNNNSVLDRFNTTVNLNSPVLIDPLGTGQTGPFLDSIFRTRDDIVYGVSEAEEGYDFRPELFKEDEPDKYYNDPTKFDGKYSWMSMLTFHESETVVDIAACPLNKIGQVDIDAIVFKSRVPGEDKSFSATMGGTGFQGGNFVIDLSNVLSTDNTTDISFIQEQMKTTTHLLLSGPDDNGRKISKWYKIANYKVNGTDLCVTLIGPTTPTLWRTGELNANNIIAYIFPNVCGVYSKKVLVNIE